MEELRGGLRKLIGLGLGLLILLGPGASWTRDFDQASPGTYYVDIVNGSDQNDGRSGRPWKTLHYAVGRINAGSPGNYTLHLAAGTYNLDNGETDAVLIVTQSNLSLIGAGAGSTVLDGAVNINWLEGLVISANNVVVRDLTVRRFKYSGLRLYGADQSELRALTIYDNGNWYESGQGAGVVIDRNSTDNLISGNWIYWSGEAGRPQYYGVEVRYIRAGTGNTISENQIHGHDFSSAGKGVYAKESSLDIVDNLIYDNYIGVYISGPASPEVGGNTIYDNYYSGIFFHALCASASPTIVNNLIYAASEGTSYGIYLSVPDGSTAPLVYHNTLAGEGLGGTGISCSLGAWAETDIKYNIITGWSDYGVYNSTGFPHCYPTVDYNCLWDNALGDYSIMAGGSHDLRADPRLDGDYRLEPGSPCIDAVPDSVDDPIVTDKDGLTRPWEAGFDLGCYEYAEFLLRVQVRPEGAGRVTGTGLDCPDDCIERFPSAAQVALTADPSSGYVFHHWEGDLSGSENPASLDVDGNKSVTAVFAEESAPGGGPGGGVAGGGGGAAGGGGGGGGGGCFIQSAVGRPQ